MPISLMKEIAKFKKEAFSRIHKDTLETLTKVTDDLVASGIEKKALKTGDKIPDFVLKDARGSMVSTKELLQEGPLVISFYRGGWCPFCSLELKALQGIYPRVKSKGANLIAISPQLEKYSLESIKKNGLEYFVLSDPDNKVAKSFGLVFALTKHIANIYRLTFDLDLKRINGTDHMELPVPATYVVMPDRKIVYAFVDADYTNRLEPQKIIESLQDMRDL